MIDFIPPPSVTVTPNSIEDTERPLTLDEIGTLAPIFAAKGATIPNPASSAFIGVIREGKIVAFVVLQVMLHAEPMYIEPGYSNVFKPLVAAAEAHILKVAGPQWVYCFTPAGKISQLASSMGMQMEPYCVMSKLVTYDPPAKHVIDLSEAEVQGAPV